MWLLSTDRAELHYFASPDSVIGGYAILSHTWGADEQSFQDIQDLAKRCRAEGTNPRDFVSSKIRNSCILANHHGYRWVWIDSCCIDKTSSTELSEAINSMFQWYSQAEVCYAFLADVPSDCVLDAPHSAFRLSRWHTRGWTLQELIAPATVIFFSRNWSRLGSKTDSRIAHLLGEITGIPWPIFTQTYHFSHYSIAVRISWASKRMTTRVEDEAYCLMGLFDVNMPSIYGEGRRAFQRLQHEIMRNSSDTSLFAWGSGLDDGSLDSQGLAAFPKRPIGVHLDVSYLLAPSPRRFERAIDFTPVLAHSRQPYPPPVEDESHAVGNVRGPFDRIELPTFAFTSYGVACRLPIFEADGFTVAVLLCETAGQHLGLLLERDTIRRDRDPTRPRYYIGATFQKVVTSPGAASPSEVYARRVVHLGNDLYNLRFNGGTVDPRWRTIHIIPNPSGWISPNTSLSRLTLSATSEPPFRIPRWLTSSFTAMGFKPFQQAWGSGRDSLLVCFTDPWRSEYIDLYLGVCQTYSQPPSRWALVVPGHGDNNTSVPNATTYHDCREHHIDLWPTWTKLFGDSDRTVQLSFATCLVNPQTTVVVHMELKGYVYSEILREANIALPTREELYAS